MFPSVLCFSPQASIPLLNKHAFVDLCTMGGFPSYLSPSESNILLLIPMDHTTVLLGPVSAFTASRDEDYRVDYPQTASQNHALL